MYTNLIKNINKQKSMKIYFTILVTKETQLMKEAQPNGMYIFNNLSILRKYMKFQISTHCI